MVNSTSIRKTEILGVPLCAFAIDDAMSIIEAWIADGKPRFVTACDVHGVMRAQADAQHMANLRRADMVTPDGMPLVWVGRMRGIEGMSRVAGPDLVTAMMARSEAAGWRHYFYGGAPGVAERMAERFRSRFPLLKVVGIESPPFREMSQEETTQAIGRINASGADIVWVGLGCPKQERWIADNLHAIDKAVAIAVGAAFDFHSATIRRAPLWMQRSGLEWLHRLCMEPGRLWRRYLVMAPSFVYLSIKETLAQRPHRTGDSRRAGG